MFSGRGRQTLGDLVERLEGPLGGRLFSVAVVLLASVAISLPLLTVRWLPFVDYPEHLGTIAAIHGLRDPAFSPYFVVEMSRTSYVALYVLGDWLAYPLGVEGAGRATLLLSISALPLAVAVFLRAHGRPIVGAALSVGIALNTYVFWGFIPYAAGMTVALMAVAAGADLNRRPDAPRTLLLAGWALLTFYTHAQLYGWMGLACVIQLAAMAPASGARQAARAAVLSALAAVPSAIALWVWLRRSNVLEQGEAIARSGHAAEIAAANAAPVYTPLAETLRNAPSHSFDVYHDGTGLVIALAFGACAIVLVSMRGFGEVARAIPGEVGGALPPPAPTEVRSRLAAWLRAWPDRAVRPSLAPELVLLLTFSLYLFAPYSYRLIEPINHRFLPLALALLPVLGPRRPLRRFPLAATGALMGVLAIGTAQAHAARFAETDREMADLGEALSHTTRGRRLLGLIHDAQSTIVPLPIYLHAHQYYQAHVGGLAAFSFVEMPKSPVQYAPGAAPPPFPPRFEWTPHVYDHAVWGEAFDYWLVRHGVGHRPHIFRGIPGERAPRPIYEGDRWTLYQRQESP